MSVACYLTVSQRTAASCYEYDLFTMLLAAEGDRAEILQHLRPSWRASTRAGVLFATVLCLIAGIGVICFADREVHFYPASHSSITTPSRPHPA